MTAKVTMGATIPVVQYGNLQPSFEVEGDTLNEALDAAVLAIKRVWDQVSDKPFSIRDAAQIVSTAITLKCWASGTEVQFDPVAHVYGSGDWLSGSAFAHKYGSDFPARTIAGKMADKHDGVNVDDVLAMWEKNAEASSTFGSAVHAALELHGKYLQLSQKLKGSNESALSKNPTLRPIVEKFFARRRGIAAYEVFLADPDLKHCGQVDRLLRVDDNTVRVQDFKTNTDLTKKTTVKAPFKGVIPATQLGLYWLQLSFYAAILKRWGFEVEGLDVFHWNGETWVHYEHDVIDIAKVS